MSDAQLQAQMNAYANAQGQLQQQQQQPQMRMNVNPMMQMKMNEANRAGTGGASKPAQPRGFMAHDRKHQDKPLNEKIIAFDRQFPRQMPQQSLDNQSKFDAAIAALKREGGSQELKPGGQNAVIGVLCGRLVVRGPKKVLDQLKQDPLWAEIEGGSGNNNNNEENGAQKTTTPSGTNNILPVTWIEEGAEPSDWLIAIDFDKTLAKSFLWAELGGLQGPQVQKAALMQWARDGRLLQAFGGEQRIAVMRTVIQERLDRGDFVCILSSGFAVVIRQALQHLGLSDILPTDLIFGCDTQPYGISKSARLSKLKSTYRREKTALIDDDLNYCRQAQKDGHKVIWVRDGLGMEKREWDRFRTSNWDSEEFLATSGRVGA